MQDFFRTKENVTAVEVKGEMMRDFVIIKDHCPFCPKWEVVKVLTGADIDLIDVRSGDPRIHALSSQIGRLTRERIPIGVVKGHLVNLTRDFYWMMRMLTEEI